MRNMKIFITTSLLHLATAQVCFAYCEDGQSIAEKSALNLASKYFKNCLVSRSTQVMQWDAKLKQGWNVEVICNDSPERTVYVVLGGQENGVCEVTKEKIKPLTGKECGLTNTYGGGEDEDGWMYEPKTRLSIGTMSEEELKQLPSLIDLQLNVLNKTESEGDILAVVKNLKENSEGEEVYVEDFTLNNVEYTDVLFYPGGNPVGVIFKKSTTEVVAYNSDGDVYCAEKLVPLPEKSTFETTEKTKMVDEAIEVLRPFAASGIETEKVAPSDSVKSALLALAIQVGYVESEEEMSWVGTSKEAWEGDSMNFGETTVAGAIEYMTWADYNEEDKIAMSPEKLLNLQNAIASLQQAGVMFGVVPLGSVQCGFTYAALAVIEPSTGRIFIIKREPSGC